MAKSVTFFDAETEFHFVFGNIRKENHRAESSIFQFFKSGTVVSFRNNRVVSFFGWTSVPISEDCVVSGN